MTRPVAVGIAALALCVTVLVAGGYGAAGEVRGEPAPTRRRKTLMALVVGGMWLALTGAIGASGILARFELRPPPLVPFFAGAVVVGVALAFSRVGDRLAHGLPLATLVGFQGFRLPLELVMHQGYRVGLVPQQMTFSGWNFDILTGASALVLAALLSRRSVPLAVVKAWNVAGFVLLMVIGTIAVVSTPLFHAFGEDPGQLNTWVAHFPYQWMGPVLVMSALAGHLVLFRRLRAEPEPESAAPPPPPSRLN